MWIVASPSVVGVCLAIVGVADQIYSGEYFWYDDQWKHCAVCKIAGFLCLMSTEVSAIRHLPHHSGSLPRPALSL